MTEKSCCRTAGNHGFTRRVRVGAFHLGRAGGLGVGHLQVPDIDNPLQFSHALKEIQNRVVRPVNIDRKRHFAVKLMVADRHGGVSADLNTGG